MLGEVGDLASWTGANWLTVCNLNNKQRVLYVQTEQEEKAHQQHEIQSAVGDEPCWCRLSAHPSAAGKEQPYSKLRALRDWKKMNRPRARRPWGWVE